MEAPGQILAMPPYPWCHSEWTRLVELRRANKLPHAILVNGQPGLGIENFALALAQYILCAAPQGPQACTQCKSCKLLNAGSHPDLRVLTPEEKSEQIRVDQIRSANEFLAQTAQQGAWKVVVLAPAHAMNPSAANALLKNLEEPAQRTLFLLVSEAPYKVLATIRSRCRLVTIAPPDMESAVAWLQKNAVKDPQALIQRVGLSPLLALDWHNNNRMQDQHKIIGALKDLLSRKSTTATAVREWAQYPAKDVVIAMLFWVEELARKNSAEGGQSQALTLLFRFSDRLRQKRALLESSANVNPALLVDELAFDLMALARTKGLIDLD